MPILQITFGTFIGRLLTLALVISVAFVIADRYKAPELIQDFLAFAWLITLTGVPIHVHNEVINWSRNRFSWMRDSHRPEYKYLFLALVLVGCIALYVIIAFLPGALHHAWSTSS